MAVKKGDETACAAPARAAPGKESDTLEARTRLTSYSALESGGLPERGALRGTSGRAETRAGLNSRLEAVSGA